MDTYLLDWRVGANSSVQNVNFERRIVNNAKFGTTTLPVMNIPIIKITKDGGGRWYSMNHQSAGTVSDPYRNILIEGSTGSAMPTLRFYMFNSEIDSQRIYNAEIRNRANLDIFGSKNEGKASPFVHIQGGSDICWIGMSGNGYCDEFKDVNGVPTDLEEAVIEVDNCPSFVISSCSYHKIGTKNTDRFYRLKEIVGSTVATELDATKGFVTYRRGTDIDDTN